MESELRLIYHFNIFSLPKQVDKQKSLDDLGVWYNLYFFVRTVDRQNTTSYTPYNSIKQLRRTLKVVLFGYRYAIGSKWVRHDEAIEMPKDCHAKTDRKKAVGIDRKTKAEAEDL
jgi:hypothetical protein